MTLLSVFPVVLCSVQVMSCILWNLRYGCWHAVEMTVLRINCSLSLHKIRNKWYCLFLSLSTNMLHCKHTTSVKSGTCQGNVRFSQMAWLNALCWTVQAFCACAASQFTSDRTHNQLVCGISQSANHDQLVCGISQSANHNQLVCGISQNANMYSKYLLFVQVLFWLLSILMMNCQFMVVILFGPTEGRLWVTLTPISSLSLKKPTLNWNGT